MNRLWREEQSSGDGIVMTRNSTRTLEDIYMGREGMRSVIISNQDVIDLVLDFSLPPSLPLALSHQHLALVTVGHWGLIAAVRQTVIHHYLSVLHTYTKSLCASVPWSPTPNSHRCLWLSSASNHCWLAAHLQPQYPHKCTQPEALAILSLHNVTFSLF